MRHCLRLVIIRRGQSQQIQIPIAVEVGDEEAPLVLEHQVDKNLGSKKTEVSLVEKRQLCREYAARFVDIQRAEFRRLGVLGNWSVPYLTMDYMYEATIVRELGRLFGTGAAYKGKKPVHWCSSCVTALAEAEVEYEDRKDPAIDVAFAFGDSGGIARAFGLAQLPDLIVPFKRRLYADLVADTLQVLESLQRRLAALTAAMIDDNGGSQTAKERNAAAKAIASGEALLAVVDELGIEYIDTAPAYGLGHSEELVGQALEPFRGKVVIATKFGFKHDPDKGPGPAAGLDSQPEQIKRVAEASQGRSLRLSG